MMYSSFCFMLLYTSIAVNQRFHGGNIFKLFITPLAVVALLMIINYSDSFIFYITKDGRFELCRFYPLLYIIDVYYIVISSSLLLRGKKALSQNYKIIIPAIIVIMITGALLDYFFPYASLIQFTFTIFITLVFIGTQNPDEYYYEDSQMMNKNAFITMCGSRFTSEANTLCIAVNIHKIDLITATLEISKVINAEGLFLKNIKQFSKKLLTFKLANGQYIIVIDENNVAKARLIYEEMCHIMEKFANAALFSFPIYSTCCLFSSPKDVSSLRMVNTLFDALKLYDNKDDILTIEPEELQLKSDAEIERIEKLVKNALSENRLEVYFQPIYNVKEKKYTSAEALIRMKDDEGNNISPGVFIPIAEKSSVIIDIGAFVIEEVCKLLSAENLSAFGLEYIEVNISMVECLQSNLASNILSVLKKYGIASSQINLEITETSASEFTDIVDTNIKTLSSKNISFSLDDFGTGYSSLSRILSLPLKLIKIDKSLVQAPFINRDKKSMILLDNFIKTAFAAGFDIVAEGVETNEMAKHVIALGCTYIQGFYFSKPLSKTDFVDVIRLNKPAEI
ncbi:MAG: EAL domain-containing protein [Lachnospiraceae bacterium]|nr:EAL domain-containing protein [Lachnospiraceae bacterium]